MAEIQSIQWFPGHMAKTRRKIQEDIKLVDVVAEILDARVPQSSSNPVLRDIIQRKPKVVLFNKSDMADPAQTSKWVSYYAARGRKAIPLESKTGKGVNAFYPAVREVLKPQIEAWEKKGMVGRPIRVMVVGIPNVGKSSFINRMIRGARRQGRGAGQARRHPAEPLVHRGKGFELLDTPGVLWPKFEDPIVGEHLAFTGAVRDEILDMEGLAARLLELLMELYPNAINTRYKTDIRPRTICPAMSCWKRVGRKRGMLDFRRRGQHRAGGHHRAG